jgi:hypothetical protein
MPGKFKMVLIGVLATGALGLGAAALATAQEAPSAQEAPGAENGGKDGGGEKQLAGPEVDKAKQAALQSVPGGKATDVSADGGEKADPSEKPDPGEPAPPAYEPQIAWSVEVTKPDGSAVTVHLDKDLKVLGTENANQKGD